MYPPLLQVWPPPSTPRPIVIMGGGDIVRDAHIPAYRQANLPVAGVFDLNPERAKDRVNELGGSAQAFTSLSDATTYPNAIFDLATPPGVHLSLLEELPDGAAVLLQKPMGTNFDQAQDIAELCKRKHLVAAVNFQLRFAPNMLAIRDIIQRGLIGDIVDMDLQITISTPWERFPFLEKEERVEIQIHSIHYLDLFRSFAGSPKSVYARTVKHPKHQKLASTKSSIILNYGDFLRANLSINHDFPFLGLAEDAVFLLQGSEGAVSTRIGVHPNGSPDTLKIIRTGQEVWEEIPLRGGWFTEAFMGPMRNLQRFVAGEDDALLSSVEDALQTMAVVEACYDSDAQGGTPLPH